MKTTKKEKIKSISLAFYFGLLILLIIVISVSFKTIDVIRKSTFDSNNRFTVAVLSKKNVDLISVSPRNGKQTNIRIKDVTAFESIENFSFPVDEYVKTDSEFSPKSKLIFLKMLFSKRSLDSSLNILDLFKLSIYSFGVDNSNFSYEEVKSDDFNNLSSISSKEFTDDTISTDKVSIQVTNATELGGFGNKIARMITNLGGNVVLVNSSKEPQEKSVIYYKKDSYTVKKISSILNIGTEKKDSGSISDVVIVLGRDKIIE